MDDNELAGLRVLIVDDNPFLRSVMRDELLAMGITRTVQAADGGTAFERLKEGGIDLVLCDYAMSPLDGLDFVRMVRNAKTSPDQNMPIIMVSERASVERVTAARDAGVNEFVAKPSSIETLRQHIEWVLEHPREFVRAPNYAGPDRRRHRGGKFIPERRRVHVTDAEGGAPAATPARRRPGREGVEPDGS
jgi:CheY-like chemotaxis protein